MGLDELDKVVSMDMEAFKSIFDQLSEFYVSSECIVKRDAGARIHLMQMATTVYAARVQATKISQLELVIGNAIDNCSESIDLGVHNALETWLQQRSR
jgi:hypothetical protein